MNRASPTAHSPSQRRTLQAWIVTPVRNRSGTRPKTRPWTAPMNRPARTFLRSSSPASWEAGRRLEGYPDEPGGQPHPEQDQSAAECHSAPVGDREGHGEGERPDDSVDVAGLDVGQPGDQDAHGGNSQGPQGRPGHAVLVIADRHETIARQDRRERGDEHGDQGRAEGDQLVAEWELRSRKA